MDSNHDFSHFTIAVIGLGLMGGSFAKRFKAIGSRVIGINRTASVAQEALRMGIVDSISEEDLKDADIVIFCTPEKGTMAFIEKKIGLLKKDAVLTDIAGVKNDFAEKFRQSSRREWISSAGIRCADMKGRDSRSQTQRFSSVRTTSSSRRRETAPRISCSSRRWRARSAAGMCRR